MSGSYSKFNTFNAVSYQLNAYRTSLLVRVVMGVWIRHWYATLQVNAWIDLKKTLVVSTCCHPVITFI